MKKNRIIFLGVGIFLLIGLLIYFLFFYKDDLNNEEFILVDFSYLSIDEVEKYANNNGIILYVSYEYSLEVDKDMVISQSIEGGTYVKEGDIIDIVVSMGKDLITIYKENRVNELGKVPIMMYHGIVDINNNDTKYIGGNVDKDGYNRTVQSFRSDLEFYYQNGYRMIRLNDYINGIVEVELGKSPIILTFDDGNENNFKVLGEENGELIIDSNCAIGILEEFKKKYPDYGVTATFFLNSSLFGQDVYNEKVLNWLVSHGYDIGNHTLNHVDFSKIGVEETVREVGGMYRLLDSIISDNYVSIVALPFGSPYLRNHDNYQAIISGTYMEQDYYTKGALRVGWEAEVSCFDKEFDSLFLKRIRAYDNYGKEFDIEMSFELLENSRYISDGDKNTVVILENDKDRVSSYDKRIVYY